MTSGAEMVAPRPAAQLLAGFEASEDPNLLKAAPSARERPRPLRPDRPPDHKVGEFGWVFFTDYRYTADHPSQGVYDNAFYDDNVYGHALELLQRQQGEAKGEPGLHLDIGCRHGHRQEIRWWRNSASPMSAWTPMPVASPPSRRATRDA